MLEETSTDQIDRRRLTSRGDDALSVDDINPVSTKGLSSRLAGPRNARSLRASLSDLCQRNRVGATAASRSHSAGLPVDRYEHRAMKARCSRRPAATRRNLECWRSLPGCRLAIVLIADRWCVLDGHDISPDVEKYTGATGSKGCQVDAKDALVSTVDVADASRDSSCYSRVYSQSFKQSNNRAWR